MSEYFSKTLSQTAPLDPLGILLRLVTAFLLGGIVSWIYVRTNRAPDVVASLPTTLVLLPILIAMVTQVIGDNVARAFSLVGALSIVRFRTVVRDTRDTAFVIFAVVVGMSVGANTPWVALLGMGVTGGAAFLMSLRNGNAVELELPFVLRVRVAPEFDLNRYLDQQLSSTVCKRRLMSVLTSKQGGLDFTYEIHNHGGGLPEELVRNLSTNESVKDVRLLRAGFDQA